MANPESLRDILTDCLHRPWLVGVDPAAFAQRVQARQRAIALALRNNIAPALRSNIAHQIAPWDTRPPATLLIAEPDPLNFLASLCAALLSDELEGWAIALGNPAWGVQEWFQLHSQLPAVTILTPTSPASLPPPATLTPTYLAHPHPPASSPPTLLIPTGGSSGQLRFAHHTEETLLASVQGFREFFQPDLADAPVNCCCVLPLYHVSGLMQALRSAVSGGQLALGSFKALEKGDYPAIAPEGFFLSLVPTQLQRLLDSPAGADWLRRFHTILLGGAPAWDDLLIQARQQGLRLAPTYGMTETASQIATLRPAEFLAGETGCGGVLPHAQVEIVDEAGKLLPTGEVGRIQIRAASLARGYWGEPAFGDQWAADDLGWLDAAGRLHIAGRSSDKIITGGENVFPVEVEAVIRATGLVRDVAVVGVGDRHWGEVVTALYVPATPQVSPSRLEASLRGKLSRFKQPKRWVAADSIPRSAQGKLNRRQLAEFLQAAQSAIGDRGFVIDPPSPETARNA
ncbi:MAG: AMP-binding protein [Cyanobacteriota bacterium]